MAHARIRLINSPSTLKPLYSTHELECFTKLHFSRSPSGWWAPDFSHFKKRWEVNENCASASLGTWTPSTLLTVIMWRKGSYLTSLAWLITKKQKSEIAGTDLAYGICARSTCGNQTDLARRSCRNNMITVIFCTANTNKDNENGGLSSSKAPFIWSRVPETTLPPSYPGRGNFKLSISLQNQPDRLH